MPCSVNEEVILSIRADFPEDVCKLYKKMLEITMRLRKGSKSINYINGE